MSKEDEVVIAKLRRVTIISMIFMIVELLGGYYAHSVAIMADAFHLLSDVIAYVISLSAVILKMRVASKRYPFGY